MNLIASEQIYNSQITAILLLDQQLCVVQANPAACELFGFSLKRLIKHPFSALFHYHHFNLEQLSQLFLQENAVYHEQDVQVVMQDGRIAHLNVSCSHAFDTLVMLEIRQVSEQLRLSKEALHYHQFQAARGLVRALAHEVKNPLSGIRGAAQLLEFTHQDADSQECCALIIDQVDRLGKLVDRLLGPNRLPNKKPQNIHQVIDTVAKLLGHSNHKQLTIHRNYDPSIPDLAIDADMLQQALLNICQNAVNALQEYGMLTLTTRIAYQQTLHGKTMTTVCIKVADNGPGIPRHLHDTLFYPMVSGKPQGTGLGLSIAQTLIDQHHGRIDFESWPGHTEFCIYLPLNAEVFHD